MGVGVGRARVGLQLQRRRVGSSGESRANSIRASQPGGEFGSRHEGNGEPVGAGPTPPSRDIWARAAGRRQLAVGRSRAADLRAPLCRPVVVARISAIARRSKIGRSLADRNNRRAATRD